MFTLLTVPVVTFSPFYHECNYGIRLTQTAKVKSTKCHYLIIINVTHISMFRNYSFNFGRNSPKRGRNMERHRERNIVELKFELRLFRPSSCVFYGPDCI